MNIEKEKPPGHEGEVVRRPEDITEAVEAVVEGVKRTLSTFGTKTVTDDSGKPIVHSDDTRDVKITINESDEEIESGAKGKADDSSTWLFRFLKRVIEKAKHFGWKIERKN